MAGAAARGDRDIRVLVVTGTGHCFSSGADFKATLQRDGSTAPHERSYAMYEPFLSLLDVAVPVIGALNGHAVGGGFGLALVCDLRIGAEDAKYGANFVRLGLAPGMAISYLLPRLVGVARANELLFAGRLVEGREAAALGILNRAVPSAQVMPVAMELAREIAAAAPLAVRATENRPGAPNYRLRDISAGGVGVDIEADALPPHVTVGAPFSLSMKLTTGMLNVPGQVVWAVTTRESDTLPPRVGVAFEPLTANMKELIDDVLTLKALPAPPWIAKVSFGK